jgi:hypothetical protein
MLPSISRCGGATPSRGRTAAVPSCRRTRRRDHRPRGVEAHAQHPCRRRNARLEDPLAPPLGTGPRGRATSAAIASPQVVSHDQRHSNQDLTRLLGRLRPPGAAPPRRGPDLACEPLELPSPPLVQAPRRSFCAPQWRMNKHVPAIAGRARPFPPRSNRAAPPFPDSLVEEQHGRPRRITGRRSRGLTRRGIRHD